MRCKANFSKVPSSDEALSQSRPGLRVAFATSFDANLGGDSWNPKSHRLSLDPRDDVLTSIKVTAASA
jgi:hypothetical protein